MIETVPFEPAHVRAMRNFDAQASLLRNVPDSELLVLSRMGQCWTFMHGEEVLCCAGFIQANKWRAQAWVLFQKTSPRLFLKLHYAIRDKIIEGGYSRIEAYTNPQHVNAQRWMRAIGFELVVPYKPLFFPDGSGASEWALDVDKLTRSSAKRKSYQPGEQAWPSSH
jgi:hypothetical protein